MTGEVGSMRFPELIREAWASARAQLVPSALIAVIALAMCLTTGIAVGRTASAEAEIHATIDEAGSRQITVTDKKDQRIITPKTVVMLDGVAAISNVFALSAPVDATNSAIGAGGTRIPAWRFSGRILDSVIIEQGRAPRVGEALISSSARDQLGLDEPIGSIETIDGAQYPIVGTFTSRSEGEDLASGALILSDESTPLVSLRVEAANFNQVEAVEQLVLGLIHPADPSTLEVDSPRSLAALQGTILADIGGANRGLVLIVLGGGATLIAVVSLADILVRRREIGRRRSLGITRATIVSLIVVRTIIPAASGAVIGSAGGAIGAFLAGAAPPWEFLAGLAVLGTLLSALSAVLPAVIAASQDPVHILRTP